MGLTLSAVAVCIATAGLLWTWLFRNYAIITANWLDDLVEYLSTEENKYKYEINDIRTCLLPKVEHVDYHCSNRFMTFTLVWAISLLTLSLTVVDAFDPYTFLTTAVGVAYVAYVLYVDHSKYCYLLKEVANQQLTFDKKMEADEHADA